VHSVEHHLYARISIIKVGIVHFVFQYNFFYIADSMRMTIRYDNNAV